MNDHYRNMAMRSIMERQDPKLWVADLTDTNQFALLDILIRLIEGLPVEDSGLFMLAWYLYHCDYQRP